MTIFLNLPIQCLAMPAAEIEAISRRGHSGAAGLCTTPAEWIEAQIGRYRAALEAPARAA